jgi:hypothetical protein
MEQTKLLVCKKCINGTMGSKKYDKINRLLLRQPKGTVYIASSLERAGISGDLQKKYRASGWLEPIGRGAMKRPGEEITWMGALYSIQQNGAKIHIGGRTALEKQGYAHYIPLGKEQATLFSVPGENLPAWFNAYAWGADIQLIHTSFLPSDAGLIVVPERDYPVAASNPARAMMECLYLAPDRFDLMEAYQLMEGMRSLNPHQVQSLLSASGSVKVNRLFLFMAERIGHTWTKYLEKDKVSLGTGKRQIVPGGVYDPLYQITVPKELERQ